MIRTSLPPLENGERLDQKTFHARYEAMPRSFFAELIGGTVYLPPRHTLRQGRIKIRAIHWLAEYEDASPGTEVCAHTTTILSNESETQPDAILIVAPEKGGQTRMNEAEYLEGAPELVVEVASSQDSIEFHAKKRDYEKAGVREYVVIAVRQNLVFWYVRRNGPFEEQILRGDGIFRSEVFPGLWLDPVALLLLDAARLEEVLKQGLATPEHAAFLARLAGQ